MGSFRLVIVVAIIFVSASFVSAAGPKPVKPGAKDKCAVCGMFVAKYQDFSAQIHFRNGSVAHFDGTKDLVKYFLQIGRYNPKATARDVSAIFVTDYYALTPLDGFTAAYVIGSDVYGPMGRELIPFARLKDAQEFSKDHKGKGVLTFKEITLQILKGLD